MSGFVDEVLVNVRGGDGGAGAISFRREAHVARGGPDGGDGGSGGDVWFVADRNVSSLLAFADHPHRRAESGKHGQGKRRHGSSGEDLQVPVPEGTMVVDRGAGVLADLVHAGDRYLAAAGGRGGKGNARFLSNSRRAPGFAEQGEKGEERWLHLELKLMADVAIVGLPNVGKSTFISRVSAAKPKVADYPFTTLRPHLGVVRTSDGMEMVLADVPGLVEGAASGRGLGHQFLRHIERARVLLVLLDLAGGADSATTLERQESVLLTELAAYDPSLVERPRIVVGSRADIAVDGIGEGFEGQRISAVIGDGLDALIGRLFQVVGEARDNEVGPEAFVVHRPEPEGVRIEREPDGSYRVVGRQAERAVALSDLTRSDALEEAQLRLRRLGVDRELARAGLQEGDVVHIGGLSFEYSGDLGVS